MYFVGFDLGTYLLRFVLAKHNTKKNKFDIVKSHTMVINFGMMEPGKEISNAAANRLERAFAKFKKYYSNDMYTTRCVATAAFRFSPSAEKIAQNINKKFGIKIEVINAKEEIYLSALGCSDYIKSDCLVVDVGSGSTEIAYVIKKEKQIEIKDYISLDLGLINNLASAAKRSIEFDKLNKFVEKHGPLPILCAKCNTLKIAYNHCHQRNTPSVDGKKFSLHYLRKALIEFSQLNNELLKQMPGVGGKKIRLIKIGLPWIYEIFKHLKCTEVTLSENGLKEGIIMDLIQRRMVK